MLPRLQQRFLTRLDPAGLSSPSPRVERVLAFSRLFLAVTSLITALPPVAKPHYDRLAVSVLVLYSLHSLLLLLWLQFRAPGANFVRWAQVADMTWPMLLCLFTDAPSSIFFIYFLFGLTAAAFRWGLRETLALSVLSAVIFSFQGLFVAKGPAFMQRFSVPDLEIHRLIARLGYLLLTGLLVGYLSETEKELRAEIGLTNRLLSIARVGKRFADALADICREVGPVFGSREVECVVRQASTGRMFRWKVPAREHTPAEMTELSPKPRESAMFPEFPHTFYATRVRKRLRIYAIDDEGRSMASNILTGLSMPVEGNAVLGVRVEIGNEWQGRLMIAGAKLGTSIDRELRFAQNAIRQIAPALYSLYLFRRLRFRTGAMERSRVARELHDTAIQSLIGIEMQVDVLRRQPQTEPCVAGELERVQGVLRKEILNLRELMQSMRPVDIGPHQFLDFTAQLVERFRRDTGIDARFVSELQEVRLSAPVCQELARVVQEGLVNIRKHSSATSAYVRFGTQNGHWQLIIDDDGKGFPFAGKMSLTELDEFHRGPTVIKERVRSIGGDMVLESNPGHGSRLEIRIPQKGTHIYG